MKHRLTVKIEKRFKRQLSKRFNPRNANNCVDNYKRIDVSCSLCDEYHSLLRKSSGVYDIIDDCPNCPFDIYKKEYPHSVGCTEWLSGVLGINVNPIFITKIKFISWHSSNNKKAIELLKKLREKAKKYIIWI